MATRFQAPKGTFDVLPGRRRRSPSASSETARELFERAGYERIETPDLRGHRAVRARGGGVHRHRSQGDVHLRGPGRPQRDPAPRGHRADRPRVPRARHADAAAAGEALWYLGPYFRHERPQAGRFRQFNAARRRGDRLRFAARRRGADHPARRAAPQPRGSGARGCGSAAWARRRRGPSTAKSWRPTCASIRIGSREDVRERIDENPLRAFDSKHEGTREVMAEAPTMLERLARRRRRAPRRGAPPARPGGRRLRARRLPRPRPRLLHAHRVRVRLRAARAHNRRSAEAVATTA